MDNIFGNSFLGRAPAWHGLGTIIPPDQALGVMDAISLAKADYRVELHPIVIQAFGQTIDTGKMAIIRQPLEADPEPRMFGVAGAQYTPIQNAELGVLLADLSEKQEWPVETVGVLGQGQQFFATLRATSVEIGADEVIIYYLISTGHDGGTATRIACTPVKVVCQNTLIMGLQAATISASVIHRGDAHGEVAWNMDVLAQMRRAQEAVTHAMQIMASPKSKLDHDEVEAVLEAAYPSVIRDTAAIARARAMIEQDTMTLDDARKVGMATKVKRADAWSETVREYRGAARARLMVFNDEEPVVAGTAWAVYNAVVETEQYRKGRSKETVGRDILFGGYRGVNIKNAFDSAYALAAGKN